MSAAADSPPTLEHALAAYLRTQCGEAVNISGLRRLAGGASHETWSFDAETGSGPPLPLILRRDFAHGLLDDAFSGGSAHEFAVLQALHDAELPVPRARWSAPAGTALTTPFMIVERAPGTDLRKALATQDPQVDRRALGLRLVRQQAAVHALDWSRALGPLVALPAGNCAAHEVERWARILEAGLSRPHPVLGAALNWLREHVPDQIRIGLVHGDFKTNNLVGEAAVLREAGQVTILDWEMMHPGDPVEDLAWTALWSTQDDLVGGLLAKDEYIAAYEAVTRVRVEPARLFYWEMFACMKLTAIFIAGVRPGPDTAPLRPQLALLGRALPVLEAALARQLQRTLGLTA